MRWSVFFVTQFNVILGCTQFEITSDIQLMWKTGVVYAFKRLTHGNTRAYLRVRDFFKHDDEWPKTYAKWISDDLEHFEFLRAHARVSACARLFENDENGLECTQNEFQTIWSILNFARALTHGRTRTRASGWNWLVIVRNTIRHLNNMSETVCFVAFYKAYAWKTRAYPRVRDFLTNVENELKRMQNEF